MRSRRRAGIGVLALALCGVVGGTGPAQATAPAYDPYQLYPLGATAESVVIADVNGDDRSDVVVSTSDGAFDIAVLLQAEDGTLRPPVRYPTVGEPGSPMALAAGDLDGNGFDDVAVGSLAGVELFYAGPSGLERRGFINFAPALHVEIANLFGDLTPEIVVSGRDGVSVFTRAPDGTGNYYGTNAAAQIQTEVEVADMTGDGLPDIVGFVRHTVSVIPQIPGNGFGPPVQYTAVSEDYWPSANGLAVGDLNDDGLADVAVSTWGTTGVLVNLFVQTETGTLSGPSLYESYGIPDPLEIADLDGDGNNDLVAANLGTDHVGVWSAGPGFHETRYPVPETADYRPNGLAVGDLNGDGIGDVALASRSNGLVVLRSTAVPPVDVIAPETFVTGGPSGTVATTAATFTFAADEPATFACSFNTGPVVSCTSPVTHADLGQGTHEFRVQASDAAGNVDPSPAVRTFTVDTRAPETTITGGPSGTITATSATFLFVADEPSTFTCSLDGGAPMACTSPAAYGGLADGPHQFQVRATDPVGNAAATPASRSFTVQRPSDLGVKLTATPALVKAKSQLTYRATVSNAGPAGNTGVSLTVKLPAQTSVVSVPAGCTAAGSPAVVTCPVGSLATGAAATFDVKVRVEGKRNTVLTATAQVTGARVDPNLSDNSASASSTVS